MTSNQPADDDKVVIPVPDVDFDAYVEPDDGLDAFEPEDFELDPAAAELPDLSNETPEPPPEPEGGQDVVPEGLGGGLSIPDYVRSTKDALALVVQAINTGRTFSVGMCLQITRGWHNVGPYYAAAKDSLAGAIRLKVAHRVEFTAEGVAKIPRGVDVYFRGPNSQYGHIAPSFGGGFIGSSDWPRGKIGRVNALTLAHAWGYTEIWWAPMVNDVRIWKPRKPASPTPIISKFLEATDDAVRLKLLQRLAAEGDGDHPDEVKKAAQQLLDARDLRDRIGRIRERADRKTAQGRSALRGLEE